MANHKHEWDRHECTKCGMDWSNYQADLKATRQDECIYIFDCMDCGKFYGEQTLTEDGRLLCPSCYSEQNIDADWVEAVPTNGQLTPFVRVCEGCGKPINRDGVEAYCYKCDPSFEENN